MPKLCPICGANVLRPEGEVAYYCKNPNCYAQRRRGVEHFVAKPAANIDGLGPKIIDKLFMADLIEDAADLFSLEKDELLGLEGFKEKSSQKLLDAIADRQTMPLARFINGLGIRLIGEGVSEVLVAAMQQKFWPKKKVITVDELNEALLALTQEELAEIDGVGNEIASSLLAYVENKQNKKLLTKFAKAHLTLELAEQPLSQALAGKIFVLTGTLPTYSRDEAASMIKQAGGKVTSSVSKQTDYVLVGEDPGSKLQKAEELGVEIIDETAFNALLK